MTDQAIADLAPHVGVREACEVLGAARAGYYRRHRHSPAPVRPAPIPHRDRPQPRALRRAGWTVTNEPAGHANVLTWTIAIPPDKSSTQGSQPSHDITTDPATRDASVASVQYRPPPPDQCALCGRQLEDDDAELCTKCQAAQVREQADEDEFDDVDDGSW